MCYAYNLLPLTAKLTAKLRGRNVQSVYYCISPFYSLLNGEISRWQHKDGRNRGWNLLCINPTLASSGLAGL